MDVAFDAKKSPGDIFSKPKISPTSIESTSAGRRASN
jgi:hypothetical protein